LKTIIQIKPRRFKQRFRYAIEKMPKEMKVVAMKK